MKLILKSIIVVTATLIFSEVQARWLNWTEVTDSASWSARKGQAAVVFDNKM